MSYAYGPSTYAPQRPHPTNPLATSGFVVALIGAVLSLIPVVGIVAWLVCPVGLILSIVGLVLAPARLGAGRGLAIAGTILGGVGLVICLLWAVAFASMGSPTASPAATPVIARSSPTAQSAPTSMSTGVPAGTFTDGTYLVGQEIAPGKYRTAGADPDDLFPYCSASRQKADGSGIGFPETTNTGPAFITVKASDGQVEFVGDCTWTLIP